MLGGSWSDRLGDHRGLYLVPVQEPLDPAARAALAPRLPRRTALVLIDGLGVEEASGMSSLASLRARGQCRRTYVGSLTVSQPMYAVVSTGLEADRTGVRNNEPPLLPLQAENLWSIARRAGLTVSGISELSWWERVLPAVGDRPSAFSSYLIRPRAENFFTGAAPGDIQIIHPIYVDEAGHDGGAASEGYRQAVRRADAELAGFARTLDLDRDLLVVTADHGHSLRGGHGGQQPRLAHVLTCYAGRGVRHLDAVGEMKSTSIAPSLALLLGLRFPMHMRAGLRGAEPDDDLDVLWQLVDPAAFPPEYLAERRRAVERFREENQRQLTTWTGGESELDHLLPAAPAGAAAPGPAAARDRGGSAGAAGGVAPSPGPGVVPLLHTSRDHGSLRSLAGAGLRSARLWDAALCAAWVVGIYLVTWVLIFAVRGSVDATAINKRAPFILFLLRAERRGARLRRRASRAAAQEPRCPARGHAGAAGGLHHPEPGAPRGARLDARVPHSPVAVHLLPVLRGHVPDGAGRARAPLCFRWRSGAAAGEKRPALPFEKRRSKSTPALAVGEAFEPLHQ